jgi:hypothetical protein
MKVPEVEITGPELTLPANVTTERAPKPATEPDKKSTADQPTARPADKPVETVVEDPFKEEPLPEDNK